MGIIENMNKYEKNLSKYALKIVKLLELKMKKMILGLPFLGILIE